MLHRTVCLGRMLSVRGPSPLEVFTQLQQGITPPLPLQRAFLLEHFREDLASKGIHEAKLAAMDLRTCSRNLRRLVFERYLAIPLRVFTFDMEFTNAPTFTAEGPTAEITEIGVYNPVRNERMSVLVHSPGDRPIPDAIVELTGITNEMLAKDGIPFPQAWAKVAEFLSAAEKDEVEGSDQRMLLLSHGGKLADVSMLQAAWKKHRIEVPREIVFGDTFNLIRDAHRRRPVTPDKHPPSWRLADLVTWLKVDSGESAHRAGDDAKMTWDALFHTLDRYGEETLTPRQQLVLRFFDSVAKEQLPLRGKMDSALQAVGALDLDAIFASARATSATSRGAEPPSDVVAGDHEPEVQKKRRQVGKAPTPRQGGGRGASKAGRGSAKVGRGGRQPFAAAKPAVVIPKADIVTDVPDL